jgi:hypothetical protein
MLAPSMPHDHTAKTHLLQVEHHADAALHEVRDEAMANNVLLPGPRHGQDAGCDPAGVQPRDGIYASLLARRLPRAQATPCGTQTLSMLDMPARCQADAPSWVQG